MRPLLRQLLDSSSGAELEGSGTLFLNYPVTDLFKVFKNGEKNLKIRLETFVRLKIQAFNVWMIPVLGVYSEYKTFYLKETCSSI